MYKYLFLMVLAFPCHATQTTPEIVNYCKVRYLKDFGNYMVRLCVEKEIKSQNEIQNILK